MKKTLVAQSIAALIGGLCVAGAAQAFVGAPESGDLTDGRRNGVLPAEFLVVNPDGIGHKNVVPYFSVQNGNDTYLNIVNSDTRNGKALKVRFRGAANSDDVFDFTLLMSPGDVFAAAITKDAATGLPKLVTLDKSCTLPNNISGRTFITTRLNPSLTDEQKAVQASEGYVEVLNMADIPPTPAPTGTTPPDLYNSIKHVSGVPRDCNSAAVNALFTNPDSYSDAVAAGMDVPTTGLATNWTIINVPTAASWTGSAVALQGQIEVCQFCEPGFGNIVFFPQSAASISVADARRYTADPLLRGGRDTNTGIFAAPQDPVLEASSFDFPDMSTPYLPGELGVLDTGEATKQQAYIYSRALSHSAVLNEFVTDPGVLAQTDWVFSMPTRRYNVARDYYFENAQGVAVGRNLFTDLERDDVGGDIPDVGGTGQGFWDPTNFFTPANTTTENGVICVTGISTVGGPIGSSAAYPLNLRGAITGDREERFAQSQNDFVISPGQPAAPLTFCGEVSVLSFNAGTGTSLLGAAVARKDLTVSYTDGWMRIATPGLAELSGPDRRMGLPTIGYAAMRFTNSAVAAGTSGNFGLTFPHRNSRANITPLVP